MDIGKQGRSGNPAPGKNDEVYTLSVHPFFQIFIVDMGKPHEKQISGKGPEDVPAVAVMDSFKIDCDRFQNSHPECIDEEPIPVPFPFGYGDRMDKISPDDRVDADFERESRKHFVRRHVWFDDIPASMVKKKIKDERTHRYEREDSQENRPIFFDKINGRYPRHGKSKSKVQNHDDHIRYFSYL